MGLIGLNNKVHQPCSRAISSLRPSMLCLILVLRRGTESRYCSVNCPNGEQAAEVPGGRRPTRPGRAK